MVGMVDEHVIAKARADLGTVSAEEWLARHVGRLLAAAEDSLVYRKALEPVARAFVARGLMFGEVPVGKDWKADITEACRFMGLLPAAEEVPPEHTASAEESFEGKGAKE